MPTKVHVVLIEDDAGVNEAMMMLLQSAGYEVQAYLSLTSFKQARNLLPDLYLIDRQLGADDGLDLCRALKADMATRHKPVIIMSANADVAALSMAAGADAFLAKPFNKAHLQTLLLEVLSA